MSIYNNALARQILGANAPASGARATKADTIRAGRKAIKDAANERYNPDQLLIIEYIGSDREERMKRLQPISFRIGRDAFGFFGKARPARPLRGMTFNLGPWQEVLPASHGLTRVDFSPQLFKLVAMVEPDGTLVDPGDQGKHVPQAGIPASAPATAPATEEPTNTEEPTMTLLDRYLELDAQLYDENGEESEEATDELREQHADLFTQLRDEHEYLAPKLLKKDGGFRASATDDDKAYFARLTAFFEELGGPDENDDTTENDEGGEL